jgi:hypothetical protein
MNIHSTRIFFLILMAFLISCDSALKDDLEQMKKRGAPRREVQVQMDNIYEASSGKVMIGADAEKWIKNFCYGSAKDNGLLLLKKHGETLFFTTPDTTIFTFFNDDDKLADYVFGTQ